MERPRHLQSWERALALLAAGIALALNVAASVELFEPQTTYGYHLVYTDGFQVKAVDAATPAARVGIVPGDHLDFRRSSLHDRIVGLAYQAARPGESVSFIVVHEGRARPVTLRAELLTPSGSLQAFLSPLPSFLRLAGFIYIAVALAILLRRPNRMTCGLFLYLVSATNVSLFRFPDRVLPAVAFASDLLSVAGTVGLLMFAVRFPNDRPQGWRAVLDRLAIPIGALLAIPNLAWDAQSLFAGESPSAWTSYGSTLGALVLILGAGATLVATYVSAPASQRQRLQWLIAGVFFSLLSYTSDWARYWALTYPLASSDALMWTATILYACAPFAIAYAVVRQRVFQVSFVVSHALVYTIVTAAIVGLFAILEWLAARFMEQNGVAIALVAFIAVGISYSIRAIDVRVEQLVDRTLFRRRHQAERQLAEVTAGLPNAQNSGMVFTALVREPVRAYDLGFAQLFSRNDAGDYLSDGKTLDPSLPLQLDGARHALRLHDSDAVLAVPVFVRSRLEAVAVYGPHVSGEDIDPDEVESLEALGSAAGLAYDHLETAQIARDATRLRRLAQHQARELAALRARNGKA